MKKSIIFYLTGTLFLIISLVLIFLCLEVDEGTMLVMASMSVPFLFTGIMTIRAGFEERKYNQSDEGILLSKGLSGLSFQVNFRKKFALPIFLILFGTVSLAIVTAFLSFNGEEDIAYAVLCVNFLYGLIITLYFLRKFLKIKRLENGEINIENEESNFGKHVAIFFASLATGGLFLVVYLLVKKMRSSNKSKEDVK
jgi:hypothetical protein